jgi:Fe-S-cluster formation regulator IscX/YfhJ
MLEIMKDIDHVANRLARVLAGVADDPAKSNEARLKAIHMAWHEEFEDAKG